MRRTPLALLIGLCTALASVLATAPAQAETPITTLACPIPPNHDAAINVIVYRTARAHNVNDKVLLSAFQAAWVESRMNNLPCGDKSSLGVFQQRWGLRLGNAGADKDRSTPPPNTPRAIVCDRNNPATAPVTSPSALQALRLPPALRRGDASTQPAQRGGRNTPSPRLATMSAATGATTSSPSPRTPLPTSTSALHGRRLARDLLKWTTSSPSAARRPRPATSRRRQGRHRTYTHSNNGDFYVACRTATARPEPEVARLGSPRRGDRPVGDVNGDGRDDIVTFTHNAPATSTWRLSTGSSLAGTELEVARLLRHHRRVPALGDVNGDGKTHHHLHQGPNTPPTPRGVLQRIASGRRRSGPTSSPWAPAAPRRRHQRRRQDDIVTFTATPTPTSTPPSPRFVVRRHHRQWNDFFCLGARSTYLADRTATASERHRVSHQGQHQRRLRRTLPGTSFHNSTKWHDFFGRNGETTCDRNRETTMRTSRTSGVRALPSSSRRRS